MSQCITIALSHVRQRTSYFNFSIPSRFTVTCLGWLVITTADARGFTTIFRSLIFLKMEKIGVIYMLYIYVMWKNRNASICYILCSEADISNSHHILLINNYLNYPIDLTYIKRFPRCADDSNAAKKNSMEFSVSSCTNDISTRFVYTLLSKKIREASPSNK